MTSYNCPFCKSIFIEFEPAKVHLETAHPEALGQIMEVVKMVFSELHQYEKLGVKLEDVKRAERRATLNDAEYMVVPFSKLTDEEFRLLMPGYPEVWADGDLESWVVKLPDNMQKQRLGIPTVKFGRL